jgi:hypothetical protein
MLFGSIAALPILVVLFSPCLIIPVGGGFFFIMRLRSGGGNPLQLWLRPTGESGDEECDISANKKLRTALLNGAEPVPCPECGWYQKDMVREYRTRQYIWIPWSALSLLLISQGVACWLMALDRNRMFGPVQTGPDHKVETWLICLGIGALCTIWGMILRSLLALRLNPNSGFPQKRNPVPGAPPAIREADFNADIVLATAKITARRPIQVDVSVIPSRRLPPPTH